MRARRMATPASHRTMGPEHAERIVETADATEVRRLSPIAHGGVKSGTALLAVEEQLLKSVAGAGRSECADHPAQLEAGESAGP